MKFVHKFQEEFRQFVQKNWNPPPKKTRAISQKTDQHLQGGLKFVNKFNYFDKERIRFVKKLKNGDFRCSFDFVDKKYFLGKLQSPKKSQISGRQTLTCNLFSDCLETF